MHVPVANRVGDENEGWRMITTQLNHERVGLAAWSGLAISLYEDIVDWAAAQPTDDGRTLIDQAWVQMDLAKCHAELEAMWLLNWRMAVHVDDGELTGAESSSIKVFGTERIIEVTRLLLGIVGRRRLPGAGLAGRGAARPGRGHGAPGADQHVRGRRERGPARDRGHGRAGHDPGGAVTAAGSGAGSGERFEELAAFPDHSAELASLVGQAAGAPNLAPDAVNVPMIRHWVEAMGDHNPVYVSDDAARAAGYDELIAPPTMLQAWIMRGLRASLLTEEARAGGAEQGSGPNEQMMTLLDDEGLTSVVATNCEQDYGRPLVVGDRLLVRSVIEAISDPKRTGLGTGRFITTRLDYVAVPDADVPGVGRRATRCRRSTTPASRWPPCASASSSTCRRRRRRRTRRPSAAPTSGHHAGQRLLVRGRPRAPAADSALHLVRHAAPPAAAGLRASAAPSSGTRSSRVAAARSTPTSSCTTRRCRRSSTRCPSA